jgi:hypothetical protein
MSPRNPRSSKGGRPAKLVVRKAHAEDRDAILNMSRGIWGGSDYLPLVWDKWLADDQGLLLTATLDGRPVGVSKITILAPGEVWLEGLRLHPDLQGRGLTRQINRVAFSEVMKLHPKSVRYSTGAGNAVSRHLGERRGFWQVARTHWMWGRALQSGRIRGRVARPGDLEEITAFVRSSECFRSTSGLYAIGWKFPALTRPRLRDLLSRERVLVSPKRGKIRGVAIYDIGEIDQDACLGFIDGADETITSLARDVLRIAGKTGHREASAMLPIGRIAETARSAGFDRIVPFQAVVYELGARGFGDGDEPLDSVLRRTLRTNEEELTDLVAGFLADNAPRTVERQNVRDFVVRNLIPDTRREILGALQPLLYNLASRPLRGALEGIVGRLIERHGLGGDAFRIGKGGVSFWYAGRKLGRVSVGRRSLRLTLGPGFGPCFPPRMARGRSWVTLGKDSFDRGRGLYAAVTIRLVGEEQVDVAIQAIDLLMKSATRGR